MLDRVAGEVRAELQALTRHHGSASDLLAYVLSPPRDGQPHRPGSHRVLFAEAATLAAEPALAD